MNSSSLTSFANDWLAAWTGNRPTLLLTFYTDDAFYADPANPTGLQGKEQMNTYFSKLLQRNPDWTWTAIELFPTENGFTLKWKANIPLANETLTIYGLDIVELKDRKISRNEVYFDRHDWIQKMIKG